MDKGCVHCSVPCLVRGPPEVGVCEMHPGRLALGHGSASPKIPLVGAWLGYEAV